MNANDYTPSVGTGAALVQPPAILAWLRQVARGRAADPFWARPALAGSALLAAALYLINLTVSGYANTYYARRPPWPPPRAGRPGSSARSMPPTSSPSTSRPSPCGSSACRCACSG